MICSKCTHKNYCNMAKLGEADSPITYCYKFKEKQQTNRDKYFRNATDEKLSQFLNDAGACLYDDADVCKKWNGSCDRCWLDWLKQEANDGK